MHLILRISYALICIRSDRRKSLTPSDLNCIFTLAARGVYADLRLEICKSARYANSRKYAWPTQYRYTVYVRLLKLPLLYEAYMRRTNVKYGRRSRVEF